MVNEEKLQITKNKLLDSTIKLMEHKSNPLKVTSREIAREAECNASMINYCFGSRENLIYNVFQKLYVSYQSSAKMDSLKEQELTPKEFLKEAYYHGAIFLTKNYNFAQAIGSYVLLKRDLSGDSFSYEYVYKHYNGKRTKEECKLIAYELSAMMQLIVCRKADVKNYLGIDIDNEDELRKLINMRVDLLLAEVD